MTLPDSLDVQECELFKDLTGRIFSESDLNLLHAPADPSGHLKENPFRLLHFIRLAAKLGWKIEDATWDAMQDPVLVGALTAERTMIGEEFRKIVESPFPDYGFELLQKCGIMQQWITEVVKGSEYEGRMSPWCMEQNNPFHTLTLDQHTLHTLKNSIRLHADAPQEKRFIMRLTAIFHDLGKMFQPIQKPTDSGSTSYPGHEFHSAVLAELFLSYLKLDEYIPPVKPLVQHHMRPHFLIREHSVKAISNLLRDLEDEGVKWSDLLNQAQADAMAKVIEPGPNEETYLTGLNALREKIQSIEGKSRR